MKNSKKILLLSSFFHIDILNFTKNWSQKITIVYEFEFNFTAALLIIPNGYISPNFVV